jgi:hypothetical protein
LPHSPAGAELSTAPGTRRWTPRDAFSRALEVLRNEGVRALVARAAAETIYRRLVLLERPCAEPLDVEIPSGLEFGYLDETALDEYEALRPGHRARATERLAAGHRCFATRLDGRLVAVRWLAISRANIEYLDLPLEIPAGAVYHYDTFTDTSVRRRGISAASQARLFEALHAEGFQRAIRAVLPENRAAVADAARAGYRPARRVGYIKLGRKRWTFGTRPGRPPSGTS